MKRIMVYEKESKCWHYIAKGKEGQGYIGLTNNKDNALCVSDYVSEDYLKWLLANTELIKAKFEKVK